MMLFDSTIRNAGGDLSAHTHLDSSGYGFLFRDLRSKPWHPGGVNPSDEIYRLSKPLYGTSSSNPEIPAGYSFFGQFIAHDLTFGVTPFRRIANQRTPRFDLDCLYAGGPDTHPQLYQLCEPKLFVVGFNAFGEPDLPRNDDRSVDRLGEPGVFDLRRSALIGDPRNDENTVVAQLHLALLLLHNRLAANRDFASAQKLTRWCYQRAVLDFVRRVCGATVFDDVLGSNGVPNLRFFKVSPTRIFIPFEFAFAAFRFGHSMLGDGYTLSEELQSGHEFPLFARTEPRWEERNALAHNNLEGQRVLPKMWTIQWDRFVGSLAQPSQCIDTRLSPVLESLPIEDSTYLDRRERSLAYRTLHRSLQVGLPSGQRIAEIMGVSDPSDRGDDPLWIFVLREAELGCGGRHLGEVGARIVAEVCIGLLAADPESFYAADPSWQPRDDGIPHSGDFQLEDLLRAAGVPISHADWEAYVPAAARS